MLRYPVKLDREGRRVLVSFPDVPGVHTFGVNRDEALARAADALETMLMGMIADREDIPLPSAAEGRSFVELPALTEAKILLYRTKPNSSTSQDSAAG